MKTNFVEFYMLSIEKDALFHAMRQSRFLTAGFISRDPSRKGVTNRNSFKTAGNGIWEP
jgi:hypothetical protein